ncbi:hypothetical protein NFI95_09365 [Acetobacteraceae bacterium KSS8]|uniref:Uncharacterized protein n=1 Tax=Endosaccharibacter trunci TaxID=2812733 RepID=A0ABT1W713_9PROT|nr:hypothetical protein [Acetobacteraceae bacterium KSS8]
MAEGTTRPNAIAEIEQAHGGRLGVFARSEDQDGGRSGTDLELPQAEAVLRDAGRAIVAALD